MIRWGILGCGDVTEVKSGPALRKAARSTVVSCMRRDAAKAADYAERHGIPRSTGDADALIGDAEVDAVYVATPPDSHAEYAVRALQAGKHVLVEKPMALTVAECDRMIEAAEASGRSLSVAFYRRALPRFEALRAICHDGTIGTPRAVAVRHLLRADDPPDVGWKLDPSVGGGGFFADMQAHTLDWLDHAFGEATRISGHVRHLADGYPAEDMVAYAIDFGPVTASALCAYTVGRKEEGVEVLGTEGSARMGFFRPSPVEVLREGEVVETRDLPDPPHVHQPFVERVVAHLLDGAPNPCDGHAGRRQAAIADALYGR